MSKNDKSQPNLLWTIFVIVALFIVARFIASFFPNLRLWGLNHAAFVPGMVALYFILGTIICLIYWLVKDGSEKAVIVTKSGSLSKMPGSRFSYLLIILAGIIFFVLAVKAHFLGDGYMAITNLSSTNSNIVGRSYGERAIQLWCHKAFGSTEAIGPYLTIRDISIAAGLIYIAAVVYYGRRLAATLRGFVIFIILSFLTPATILYYGYVETYSLATAFIYIFLLSAVSALKQGRRSPMPIVAFLAATYLHWINIVYLPALLLYFLFAFGGKGVKSRLGHINKYIIPTIVAAFILFYIFIKNWGPPFWNNAFISFFSGHFTMDNYTLLAPKHLLDFANLLIFIAPVTAIITIAFAVLKIKWSEILANTPQSFLVTALISGLAAAFILEPKLGMARDWDLMSTMLAATQLCGVYCWIDRFHTWRHFSYSSVLLIMYSLAVFVPWLALNYSSMNLYRYAIANMKLDPHHGFSGFYAFKNIMNGLGYKNEASQLERYCNATFPEYRLERDAGKLYNANDLKGAIACFDRAIQINPAWYSPYYDRALCLNDLGKPQEALADLAISDALNPYNRDVAYQIGRSYYLLKNDSLAVRAWRICAAENSDWPVPIFALGKYFYEHDQYDSATIYFSSFPDSAYPKEIFFYKGMNFIKSGEKEKALHYLDDYLTAGQDLTKIREIQRLKETLFSK